MNRNKILWHYRCQYLSLPNVGYEEYERTYWVPSWDSISGYYNSSKYWRLTSAGHDFLNSTLHKLIHKHGIEITKEELKDYLERPRVNSPYRRAKKNRRIMRWGYRTWDRCGRYVRRSHHRKKELTDHEIAKREWRKKKSKRTEGGRNYRVSPWFKHYNKRTHRAFERKCIDTHQTHKLHDRTWYQMENRWSWD